jgi:hypothetical protein
VTAIRQRDYISNNNSNLVREEREEYHILIGYGQELLTSPGMAELLPKDIRRLRPASEPRLQAMEPSFRNPGRL